MDEEEDLETIGEQLYTRIYSEHKETAGKLTGELTRQRGKIYTVGTL